MNQFLQEWEPHECFRPDVHDIIIYATPGTIHVPNDPAQRVSEVIETPPPTVWQRPDLGDIVGRQPNSLL